MCLRTEALIPQSLNAIHRFYRSNCLSLQLRVDCLAGWSEIVSMNASSPDNYYRCTHHFWWFNYWLYKWRLPEQFPNPCWKWASKSPCLCAMYLVIFLDYHWPSLQLQNLFEHSCHFDLCFFPSRACFWEKSGRLVDSSILLVAGFYLSVRPY